MCLLVEALRESGEVTKEERYTCFSEGDREDTQILLLHLHRHSQFSYVYNGCIPCVPIQWNPSIWTSLN